LSPWAARSCQSACCCLQPSSCRAFRPAGRLGTDARRRHSALPYPWSRSRRSRRPPNPAPSRLRRPSTVDASLVLRRPPQQPPAGAQQRQIHELRSGVQGDFGRHLAQLPVGVRMPDLGTASVIFLALLLAGCSDGPHRDASQEPDLVGEGPCAYLPYPGGPHVLTVHANYSTSQGHPLPPIQEIVIDFDHYPNYTTIESSRPDAQGCVAFSVPGAAQYWISAVRRAAPTDDCAWSDGHRVPYNGSGFVHVDLSLTVTCN
jgi:hypothetical protein